MNKESANDAVKSRLDAFLGFNPLQKSTSPAKSAPSLTPAPRPVLNIPSADRITPTPPTPPIFDSPLKSTQVSTEGFEYSEANPTFPSIKVGADGKVVEVKKTKGKIREYPIHVISKIEDLKQVIQKIYESGQACTLQFKKAGTGFQSERPMNGRFIPIDKEVSRKQTSPFIPNKGRGEKFLFGDQALYNNIRIKMTQERSKAGVQITPEVKQQIENEARKEAGLKSGFLYAIQYINGGGYSYVVDLDPSVDEFHQLGSKMSKVPYIAHMLQKSKESNQSYQSPPPPQPSQEGVTPPPIENNTETPVTKEVVPMQNINAVFNQSILKFSQGVETQKSVPAAQTPSRLPAQPTLALPTEQASAEQAPPVAEESSSVPIDYNRFVEALRGLREHIEEVYSANPNNQGLASIFSECNKISSFIPTVTNKLKRAALL